MMLATAERSSDIAAHLGRMRPAPLPEVAAGPTNSLTPAPHDVVRRKASCACGGGCPHCRSQQPVQTKLNVSAPGDRSEREADGTAARVMDSQAAPTLRRKPAPDTGAGVVEAPDFVRQLGPGRPLDAGTRDFFEPRFGQDFGGVRVHADGRAAESAREFDAQAYTVGRDVVFDAGRYAPETPAGRGLLAHELAHVAQNESRGASVPVRVSRQPNDPPKGADPKPRVTLPLAGETPEPLPEPERPPGKLSFKAKDLLWYPLIVDIFSDIILKKDLTESERKKFKLKGYEGGALMSWAAASMLASSGLGGSSYGEDFLNNLKLWYSYTEAIQPLTPHKDVLMDGLSTLFNMRVDEYLGSDLFAARLKAHPLSLLSIGALLQGGLSLQSELKKPDPADEGKLVTADWAKHTLLGVTAVNLILKQETKAPGFFDFGPLLVKTHPGYNVSPLVGAKPPEGFAADYSKGQGAGEGGQYYKFGGTLNLNKLVNKFATKQEVTSEDMDNLQKYRGWQTSLWFNYERLDPTKTMAAAGTLTDETVKGGLIFGGDGHLIKLEAGARYDGAQARELTSFMFSGGYGISGQKGSVVKRLGFNIDFIDWTDKDILAPRDAAGAPVGGSATRLAPFFELEGGKRHKFGVGAGASLITGQLESSTISDFRGNLAYTYMGDTAEGGLPKFKLELGGSYGRLDWWDPRSPNLLGLLLKGNIGPFGGGVQVNTGAGDIPDQRAAQVGAGTGTDLRGPETKQKARVPTSVLFSASVLF